jgi:tetratricopeptide (TPR) repeat protein
MPTFVRRTPAALALAIIAVTATSYAAAQDKAPAASADAIPRTAPLLEGLGDHHHPVSTQNERAQRYFNQGMVLAFNFNHGEAARSFREAQRLDPDCAMAYWGEAWALGPNINMPMDPASVPLAWAALQKALERLDKCTPRERDYIRALAQRYVAEPVEDRSHLDVAFADAMRHVAARHPDDYDAQIVFAESLMDTTPWNYWDDGDKPKDITGEILAVLERVLARRPNHPQACHLYIHAVEEPHPEWALACADRLGDLCPGAGHLVHMPSHIYIRIGRYSDAVDANELASVADDSYADQCHAQGLYPIAYMPHNHHFIWFGCCMLGRNERALEAACHMAEHVDQKIMREPGFAVVQHFSLIPLYTMVRFGEWDLILAEPAPVEDLKYPRGIWHFARGMAQLRKGRPAEAQSELDKLKSFAADESLRAEFIWQINTTGHLLQIAEQALSGEIAAAKKDYEAALAHLREAVRIEDSLVYEEPQSWYAPTRLTLGAVLLNAGRAAEAETTFREDLVKYPHNGWALFGLSQALEAQGKREEAAAVSREFDEAWQYADLKLASPRY